jgi:hypothetical protein
MTHLQRRLRKLEGVLTDPVGLIPHTRRWLEYWDRQYCLYLTGEDPNAIWYSSVAAYRAVMKYAWGNPDSMVGRHWAENKEANKVARIA